MRTMNFSTTVAPPPNPLREYIAMPLEVPLLLFHVSVTAFIAQNVQKRANPYTNTFFKLFLIQCASNYLSYLTLLYQRMLVKTVQIAPPGPFAFQVVFNTVYQFAAYFQLTTYTAITANRWTAIVYPVRHQWIWEGQYLRWNIAVQLAIPLAFALLRPVLALVYIWALSVSMVDAFDVAGLLRSAILSAANFFVTAVNVPLVVWSSLVYRKMDKKRKRQNHENFRLLVFTMLEMVLQLIKVVYYALNTAQLQGSFITFMNLAVFHVLSLQVLCGPIFLLAISGFLRRSYLAFYGLAKKPKTVARLSVTR